MVQIRSQDDAERIKRAVRHVEGQMRSPLNAEHDPILHSPIVLTVRITGAAVSGYYPAQITVKDPSTSTWSDEGEVRVFEVNDETPLVNGRRYLGVIVGEKTVSGTEYNVVAVDLVWSVGCFRYLDSVTIVCNSDGTLTTTQNFKYARGNVTTNTTPCP